MDILILGGSRFLGRALVEAAALRGHTLTLFNRGQTNSELFPDVEKLRGDRDGGLDTLRGRRWDAVIDTCGYVPRIVRQSAELLANTVDHYTFISSLSAYADSSQPGVDENGAVATMEDESIEEITGETYGPLKVLCERAVEAALPGRTLVIRPGLIVGSYDPTDRFSYWPHRVAQGGEVLAPGRPERGVQFIDVYDLAEWTLRMVEAGRSGIYNADGPAQPIAMGVLLDACVLMSGSDATFTWVSDDFLAEQKVQPWMEMPLWIPESDPDAAGFFAFSIEKARAAGLTFRLLSETIRGTLDWCASRSNDHEWRAGISREREAKLLRIWADQSVSSNA